MLRRPGTYEGTGRKLAAYLAIRRVGDGIHELGVIGRGTCGLNLAQELSDEIAGWNEDRDARPALRAYPAGTPDPAFKFDSNVSVGPVIDKAASRSRSS
ncbi:hypothetical protein GCM10009745_47870 [Kribbella yunnanensis]|uniref:Uncharacterized protein n=1 Tax=Kribbella yunnanensis TaxID=190194 RepID=A0ABP4U2A0_9ACTN